MMKYNVIYADPPWEYKTWSKKGNGRSAESHYNTQTIEHLKSFNINDIADTNCVLLMWVIFPCIEDGLALGKTWGFKYKTIAFNWVKMNKKSNTPFIGMGYYTRANSEVCLLFTKGKPLKRVNRNVEQVIIERVGKHSQKPSIARKRIVDLFGDVPRVELFARSREGMFPDHEYEGWDVYGNQVNNSITLTNDAA